MTAGEWRRNPNDTSSKVLALAAGGSPRWAAPCALAIDSVVLKVECRSISSWPTSQLPRGEYRVVKTQDAACLKICSKDQKHTVATFSSPLPAELETGWDLVFPQAREPALP